MRPGRDQRLWGLLDRFARDESAATAIEYAMIAVGIAGAVVVMVYAVGDALLENKFEPILRAFTES